MAQTEVSRAMERLVPALRHFLRDYSELNRLIAGEESSDRFLTFAILDALDDFNLTAPITNYGPHEMPSVSLLLRGATISVLESVGLLQTRNQINYRDGDGILPLSDRTPLIMSWLQMFSNRYEQKKQKLKIALNIDGALDKSVGISSEYSYVSWAYAGF